MTGLKVGRVLLTDPPRYLAPREKDGHPGLLTFKSTPPAGGIEDPRGAIDFLYADRQVTQREYDFGLFYAAVYRSEDPRCQALLDCCDDAFNRVEIDMVPLLRAVVIHHKRPKGTDCMTRLRRVLNFGAVHVEQIELGWLEAAE